MALTLKDAYALIKSGDKSSARPIISAHIKANPTDYKGWWLMANAVDRDDQKVKALEKVLELNPDFEPAVKMMDALPASEFGDLLSTPPQRKQKTKPKKKSNNIFMYLGIAAVIMLFVCGGIVYGIQRALNNFAQTFVGELGDIEDWEDFDLELSEANESLSDYGNSLVNKGNISKGQSKNGNVDSFDDDAWIFEGSSGQTVTIDVVATDDELDPQVSLYDPSGNLIAHNDDIDLLEGNWNSRVSLTLPSNGSYTIVVSAFGLGGSYSVSVR